MHPSSGPDEPRPTPPPAPTEDSELTHHHVQLEVEALRALFGTPTDLRPRESDVPPESDI